MSFLIRFILLSCFWSTAFAADEPAFSPLQQNDSILKTQPAFLPVNEAFSVLVSEESARLLKLEWQVTDGYYLYKTRFKFASNDVQTGEAQFPPGEIVDDPYIGKTEIFTTSFVMHLPIDSIKNKPDLNLQITFQGCAKAGYCYPPETITVPINNVNLTNAAHTRPIHVLGWYVLLAFLGGLILNLMPCVFPVLSIKVLSFAKHSENPHYLKLHGWIYTAGVVLSFIVIAALLMYLRAAGETIGWGFQLQNPVFIIALIILFFIMSLHLFGFLNLDKFLSGFSNHAHVLTQGHHLKASFFTGLLSVLVATPCTVPFMAPAVGFALTQSSVIALLIFAALGLGLALPFLVLTHCPSLIARLPKPGPWMVHLKQLLAFPLLLTAVWLLWVLGHQTGIHLLIKVILLGVAVGFGVWLWRLHYRKTLVVVAIIIGALCVYTAGITYHKPIDEPFTQARLDELRAAGEPVFINMTADWCITCLVNERVALSSNQFKEALTNNRIHYLKGDWTNQNPEITAFLKAFGRSGIPLYVYYPSGAYSMPILLPQLLTPDTVIEAITTHQTP
jgi:thiol:disulfide interchange protein DsbD